jgi:hypothetical protein
MHTRSSTRFSAFRAAGVSGCLRRNDGHPGLRTAEYFTESIVARAKLDLDFLRAVAVLHSQVGLAGLGVGAEGPVRRLQYIGAAIHRDGRPGRHAGAQLGGVVADQHAHGIRHNAVDRGRCRVDAQDRAFDGGVCQRIQHDLGILPNLNLCDVDLIDGDVDIVLTVIDHGNHRLRRHIFTHLDVHGGYLPVDRRFDRGLLDPA